MCKFGINLEDEKKTVKMFSIYDIRKNDKLFLDSKKGEDIIVDFNHYDVRSIKLKESEIVYYLLQYKIKQYILPFETINNIDDFCQRFKKTDSAKRIAIVKGVDFNSLVNNYLYLRNSSYIDKIAFNLDSMYFYQCFKNFYEEEGDENLLNMSLAEKLVIGRSIFIKQLFDTCVFTWKKKHILLSPETTNFCREKDYKVYQGNSFEYLINSESFYE